MNLDEFEGHTPGPWILQDLYDNLAYFACRVGADRETYGHLWRVKHLPMKQYEGTCFFTNEADAKLIAAAPDLFQALIDERAEVKRLHSIVDEQHTMLLSQAVTISNLNKIIEKHMVLKGDE